MNILAELESLTAFVLTPQARQRLARVIDKLKADAEAEKVAQMSPKPRKRATGRAHDAAVKAGRQARAAGHGKEGQHRAGTLQERSAWLAGWNDEDIRRNGR